MRRTFVILGLTLMAVGCGTSDTPTQEPEATATATAPADDAGDATVQVAQSSLGDILVDAEGRTLYLFEQDAEGRSNCTGACAGNWPPLEVDGQPVAGEGVDQGKLATITREDGTTQVTYGGHPLYTFARDEEPGDVNGHGANDVWFAVTPAGTAAAAAS